MVSFTFKCVGHPNVTSSHRSTLEFTADSELTLKGDCILGVNTTANLFHLPENIKDLLRDATNLVKVTLRVDEYTEEIKGAGHPALQLTDKVAIIIRKSDFLCPRTLMINADKSAIDISKEIRKTMKNPTSVMEVTIQFDEGAIEASKHA